MISEFKRQTNNDKRIWRGKKYRMAELRIITVSEFKEKLDITVGRNEYFYSKRKILNIFH